MLEVQPGSTAAVVLSQQQQLRPSMVAAVPYAFELRVHAVCLSGLDLPLLLPPSAALPPQYDVLPSLAEGVEDARAAAAAATEAAAEAEAAPLLDTAAAVDRVVGSAGGLTTESAAAAAASGVASDAVDVQGKVIILLASVLQTSLYCTTHTSHVTRATTPRSPLIN